MIKKITMVSTIIVLTFLIIITPTFISKQTPIGAIPRVLIDNMKYVILVDVGSAVEDYRYWNISMTVNGLDNLSYHRVSLEEQTYDLHLVVAKNDTSKFELNITLFDRNDRIFIGYDFNATVEAKSQLEANVMEIRRSDIDQVSSVSLGNVFRDTLVARSARQ